MKGKHKAIIAGTILGTINGVIATYNAKPQYNASLESILIYTLLPAIGASQGAISGWLAHKAYLKTEQYFFNKFKTRNQKLDEFQ